MKEANRRPRRQLISCLLIQIVAVLIKFSLVTGDENVCRQHQGVQVVIRASGKKCRWLAVPHSNLTDDSTDVIDQISKLEGNSLRMFYNIFDKPETLDALAFKKQNNAHKRAEETFF